MKITGVMPLRNATKLGYPYELAIKALRPLCDEVVVLVDPTSEDDTMARVRALTPDRIVESVWDISNHRGHTNCEITVQTQKACAAASGDWIFSLQADELLHERDANTIRMLVERAESIGVTGLELRRLYFYGSLERVRDDWTLWLLRLFKRGLWKPDVDGAMRFDPIDPNEKRLQVPVCIYHYSRVGDPTVIAERVRNLDGFFHEPAAVKTGELAPYDFSEARKLDTYVIDAKVEAEPNATFSWFPAESHPQGVRELFAWPR